MSTLNNISPSNHQLDSVKQTYRSQERTRKLHYSVDSACTTSCQYLKFKLQEQDQMRRFVCYRFRVRLELSKAFLLIFSVLCSAFHSFFPATSFEIILLCLFAQQSVSSLGCVRKHRSLISDFVGVCFGCFSDMLSLVGLIFVVECVLYLYFSILAADEDRKFQIS